MDATSLLHVVSPSWRAIGAVVIGGDHLRNDTACQDAARCSLDPDGRSLVLAVSDGAGSARLSEVGAALACEAAMRFFASLSAEMVSSDPVETLGSALLHEVVSALSEEAGRREVDPGELACTLIAARVDEHVALFVQLGDGAIVLAPHDAPAAVVFWPHKGEHANETVFVTSRGAERYLQIHRAEGPIDELALLTDGLERLALDFSAQTPHAAFFAPFFEAVRELAPAPGPTPEPALELAAELAAFLASPRILEATGDDKTLLIATRR